MKTMARHIREDEDIPMNIDNTTMNDNNNDNKTDGNKDTTTTTTNSSTNIGYTTLKHHLLSLPHTFHSPPTSPHPLLIPQQQQQQRTTSSSTSSSSSTNTTLPTISSLSLHPTLESTLHILNLDLPSAHFLLRHAQSSPAYEMMMLHGILHRVEGDIDNTRAWFGGEVERSEVFKFVWGNGDDAEGNDWRGFLGRVERVKDRIVGRKGNNYNDNKKNNKGRKGGDSSSNHDDDREEEEIEEEGKEKEQDWVKEEEELRKISLWEITRLLEFCEKKFGVGEVRDATEVWVRMGEKHGKIANDMIVGGEGWREF